MIDKDLLEDLVYYEMIWQVIHDLDVVVDYDPLDEALDYVTFLDLWFVPDGRDQIVEVKED